MSRLTNADISRVLGAVHELNSGISMSTLEDRSLKCVLSVIPSEMTVFDGFDTEGEYSGFYWYSPPGSVADEWVNTLIKLIPGHPAYNDVLLPNKEKTFRTTEYLSLSEFHKTALYNEVYRHIGGDAQMATAMRISPTCYVTNSMYREKTDFTENELETLKLLTPHLATAFRNTQAFERVDSELKYLATAVKRGIAVIGVDLGVIFINEIAEKLLQHYFGDHAPDKLPDSLQRYIQTEGAKTAELEYYSPAEPYRVREEDRELLIRLTFDSRTRELTLLFEEKIERSGDAFRCIGLTLRQSEVLMWMSKGKTDAEIALLCDISPRTVEKHAENLFVKLGVETRTAAVMTAIEKLAI